MLGSLSDRLLALVVPKSSASANPYCWYEYSGPACRYCCDPPGSTPVSCTRYRLC
ncbi:hypothetical protein ACFXKD_03295 [Nocardiopsis aegyptia]|uniref:hypothetical protein n=1 Tax=Nocardiopsis aegyptia TaxID=220378 RepID=UPI0036735048